MGAWGVDSFANDDAMDWVGELGQARDLTAVRGALAKVADGSADYLEAPEGSVALAAAEVVAALRDRPAAELPEEVTRWVAANRGEVEPALVELARRAVDVVVGDTQRSELRQLWDEADAEDAEAWRAGAADLRSRLV